MPCLLLLFERKWLAERAAHERSKAELGDTLRALRGQMVDMRCERDAARATVRSAEAEIARLHLDLAGTHDGDG